MGCTTDVLNIKMPNQELATKMLELFYEVLKDDLYSNKLSDIKLSEDENGCIWTNIYEEPLFTRAENGAQIEYFIESFIEKYPDIPFEICYNCTYSVSSECTYIEYKYENKQLTIKEMFGEDSGIFECTECDEYFDEPLMFIEEYEDGETYICPNCGTELSLDVNVNIRTKIFE